MSKAVMNELDLVQYLQAGDRKAFEILYDRYAGAMAAMILQVVPNPSDAENVLQDSLVKVCRNIHLFDPAKGRLYTFLVMIARRMAIDFTRSNYFSAQKKIQNPDILVHKPDQEDLTVKLDNELVFKTIKILDIPQRKIIELLYFKGYTQQEVSEELDIPLGTVKSRTRSAINHLRKHLTIK